MRTGPTEPASVVAARQLAYETRDRLPRLPRVARRRPRARAVTPPAALAAVSALTVACSPLGETACPAIAYGSSLIVRLDDAWSTGVARTVEVDCGTTCAVVPSLPLLEDAPPTDPFPGSRSTPEGSTPEGSTSEGSTSEGSTSEGSTSEGSTSGDASPPGGPADTGGARLALGDTGAVVVSLVFPGDPLTLRVREGDLVVAEDTVSPDWVRVGGTAECGGPAEATVVVPAP